MASVTTTSAFILEIDSVQIATFKSVSGLQSSMEKIEYKQSTSEGKMEIKYHPGALKWEPIKLERYYDGTTNLYTWYSDKVKNFDPEKDKVTGSIKGLDKKGEVTMQWDFEAAWPMSYTGPELKVDSNEIVTEAVEIAHEGIRKVK
jgi:phage tail-like protein